jgi:hypothetical protein
VTTQAVGRAAPYVRAAMAKLDPPWSVCKSGLEIISPPAGNLFTPYFVCLERLNGLYRVVYPNGWRSAPANLTRAKDAAYGHARHLLAQETPRGAVQTAETDLALTMPPRGKRGCMSHFLSGRLLNSG